MIGQTDSMLKLVKQIKHSVSPLVKINSMKLQLIWHVDLVMQITIARLVIAMGALHVILGDIWILLP